jgi:hypothetical protein
MGWTSFAVAVPLGFFVLAANITPAGAQQRDQRASGGAVRAAVHQEIDEETATVFSSTVDQRRNAVITVKAGDFTLEKSVAANGDSTLRLSQDQDVVSIALTRSGYVVSRAANTARFDPQSSTPEDLDAIRAVLLGSHAVRSFRRLTAILENRDGDQDEGPLFMGAIVDGGIVGMLDGDAGATERAARRITRKMRANLKSAAFSQFVPFRDCILEYENAVMSAWDLLYECTAATFNAWVWWRWGQETFCELEFFLRSQQYAYQFLSCFAFPF